MPIADVLKQLPPFGKPFFHTEDEFIASGVNAGGALFSGSSMTDGMGKSISTSGDASNAPQEIIICCKNKRRKVHGFISEGVKLKGQSDWKEMFDSGVLQIGKNLVDAADATIQAFKGASIQQPYMNRKMWVSSKPFDISFNFTLINDYDTAENDVYLPAQALMSFCYPRSLDAQKKIHDYTDEHFSFVDLDAPNSQGETNLLGATVKNAGMYSIPGPALGYQSSQDGDPNGDQGDAVTITIGNMFAFGACYLKSVDLEFSPTIDHSGYPIWCKCAISTECMDANYCDSEGNFLISQYQSSADGVGEVIDALKTTASDAAKNVVNIAKATVNALK